MGVNQLGPNAWYPCTVARFPTQDLQLPLLEGSGAASEALPTTSPSRMSHQQGAHQISANVRPIPELNEEPREKEQQQNKGKEPRFQRFKVDNMVFMFLGTP